MRPTSPLKVLHICAPGIAGGLETVVLDLTSGLCRLDVKVMLVPILDPGAPDSPLASRAAELGVEVYRIAVPIRNYVREFRKLRAIIDGTAPDVVHTHGYRADLIAGLAARRAGVPWVSTAHGFTGGGRKNRFYEWLQVNSYRWAEGVVAVSGPIKERLKRAKVTPNRIHLLPNAWVSKIPLPRELARQRLGLVGTEPVIGWVGRLSHEKGADVFLDALGKLRHRSWRAAILGDGRERSALEAKAQRLGISERVRWHGVIPDAAVLFAAFDVWVLSSRTEGTPMALFEAMAAGVPVVATSVGGVPDVVSTMEAILVPSDDSAAIAVGVDAILTDHAGAATRTQAAHLRLDRSFAAGKWLRGHLHVHQTIANARKRDTNA